MKKLTLSDLILTIRSLYEKLLGPSKSPTELSRRAVSKPKAKPVARKKAVPKKVAVKKFVAKKATTVAKKATKK